VEIQVKIQKEQVRRFYEVLWNGYDKRAMPALLHPDFEFRGSLGQETRGHAGFADYLDTLHKALGDYRCAIEDWVAEGDKVFAKMRFSGIHRDRFMGYAPTQKTLSWMGCALFTFDRDRISKLWVLGDLKNLEAQLEAQRGRAPEDKQASSVNPRVEGVK